MKNDKDKARAIRMIAPLLRIARESSHEPEAKNARRRAAVLMKKYNLTDADLYEKKKIERPRKNKKTYKKKQTNRYTEPPPAKEPILHWPGEIHEHIKSEYTVEEIRETRDGKSMWQILRSENNSTADLASEVDVYNENCVFYGESVKGGMAMYKMKGDKLDIPERVIVRSVNDLSNLLEKWIPEWDMAWKTNLYEIIAKPISLAHDIIPIHPEDAEKWLIMARNNILERKTRRY